MKKTVILYILIFFLAISVFTEGLYLQNTTQHIYRLYQVISEQKEQISQLDTENTRLQEEIKQAIKSALNK